MGPFHVVPATPCFLLESAALFFMRGKGGGGAVRARCFPSCFLLVSPVRLSLAAGYPLWGRGSNSGLAPCWGGCPFTRRVLVVGRGGPGGRSRTQLGRALVAPLQLAVRFPPQGRGGAGEGAGGYQGLAPADPAAGCSGAGGGGRCSLCLGCGGGGGVGLRRRRAGWPRGASCTLWGGGGGLGQTFVLPAWAQSGARQIYCSARCLIGMRAMEHVRRGVPP